MLRLLHSLHPISNPSSQSPGKHKHPCSQWHHQDLWRLVVRGRMSFFSRRGEQGKHGDLTMEEWNGEGDPFAPTTSCLSSLPLARWLPYTSTRSSTRSSSPYYYFFYFSISLRLSAALITHWNHVVSYLLCTVWGVKDTHHTLVTEQRECSRGRKTCQVWSGRHA